MDATATATKPEIVGSIHYRYGYEQAQYQTAGLGAANAPTVHAWAKAIQEKLTNMRKPEKRELYKGALRGYRDWLAQHPDAPRSY